MKISNYSLLLLFLIGVTPLSVKSQNLKDSNCSCETNFISLSKKVEESYVGFPDKVPNFKIKSYQKFRDSLRIASRRLNGYECYNLFRSYLQYFRDPHLSISISNDIGRSKDELRKVFGSLPKDTISENSLRNYFLRNKLDRVEGIWKTDRGSTTIAIYKIKEDCFSGIILKADSIVWFPGQVKLEINKALSGYKLKFYRYDHSLIERSNFEIGQDRLIINGVGWNKIFPGNGEVKPFNDVKIQFRALSQSTNLLQIKTSLIEYKETLDSLIGNNWERIQTSENLILDLRSNNGGHAMFYDTLMPLVSTRPYFMEGLTVMSSSENIEFYKEGLVDSLMSEPIKAQFRKFIKLMEDNPGKRVKVSDGDTVKWSSYPFPKKIGIIADAGTLSAAEQFILDAKHSSTKVTLFGENTRGALDYTEIGGERKLPCNYLVLYCPMGMSSDPQTQRIDNIGIVPDILIEEAVDDWIVFTKEYLETH